MGSWTASPTRIHPLPGTFRVKTSSTVRRCPWVDLSRPDYVRYHDEEWGVPVHDDRRIFEFLILEGAQAGLSWYTVLRKRDAYRRAFADFDPRKVAAFGERQAGALLKNAGIIRNRAKIAAAIANAKSFLAVQEEFGSFDRYIWGFVGGAPIVHRLRTVKDYPARSPESDALSKDLQRRGFKFVGSTICYAHMQATGMINDHVIGCFRRRPLLDAVRAAASGRRGSLSNRPRARRSIAPGSPPHPRRT